MLSYNLALAVANHVLTFFTLVLIIDIESRMLFKLTCVFFLFRTQMGYFMRL